MNEIDQTILELDKYAELESSEWGETVYAIIILYQLRTLLSPELIKALETEIKAWLKDAKENTVITEEVITPLPYTVKYLEWI